MGRDNSCSRQLSQEQRLGTYQKSGNGARFGRPLIEPNINKKLAGLHGIYHGGFYRSSDWEGGHSAPVSERPLCESVAGMKARLWTARDIERVGKQMKKKA
jgi:hypothetical protein